jgi:hypothetical protein
MPSDGGAGPAISLPEALTIETVTDMIPAIHYGCIRSALRFSELFHERTPWAGK